jgi:hypothetical protein
VEEADARRTKYREMPVLASQYARRGVYIIKEYDAEQLPDGRVIIGNRIFPRFNEETPGSDEEIAYYD